MHLYTSHCINAQWFFGAELYYYYEASLRRTLVLFFQFSATHKDPFVKYTPVFATSGNTLNFDRIKMHQRRLLQQNDPGRPIHR